jgi:signal transduction histidine kinase
LVAHRSPHAVTSLREKIKGCGIIYTKERLAVRPNLCKLAIAIIQRHLNVDHSTEAQTTSVRSLSNFELLANAVQHLSLARSIEDVMAIVRTVARRLTGADGATFVLRDGNQCYYADEDAIGPLWKGSRFPVQTCISGWVMENKLSAVIPDIYKDDRIPHDSYRPTFVKSLVMVPIRKLNPLGAIGNYWATAHVPSPDHVKVLQALADITAVSIENIYVYNELEKRVKDRTSELELANTHLFAVNRELETLVYSLSHDLRAPLRNLNFTLGMLVDHLDGKMDETAQDMTSRMSSKIGNAQVLIDDLITLFTMSKQELVRKRVNMKELVNEVYHELIEHEPPRKIHLQINELPEAIGDRTLLKQVWVNLISNALKYSRLQPVTKINVGFQQQFASIIYCIEDNGVGFDMKYYDKIFAPFQRLHQSADFEGAGIGLSIVQKIISRHQGKVWCTSVPNNGTTFFFQLPAEQTLTQ